MNFEHEVIFCVVNAGFADAVMDAAKEYGARGGTVIHARGTANSLAEKKFEIPVQPEKEVVMILVPSSIRMTYCTDSTAPWDSRPPGRALPSLFPWMPPWDWWRISPQPSPRQKNKPKRERRPVAALFFS